MDVINGDSPNIWIASRLGLGPGFRGLRPGGLQYQSGRRFGDRCSEMEPGDAVAGKI